MGCDLRRAMREVSRTTSESEMPAIPDVARLSGLEVRIVKACSHQAGPRIH